MNKALLVWYSRSGYTASLAGEMASMAGWDADEVKDVHPRAGNWGAVRCVLDVLLRRSPAIRSGGKDPAAYDLVVLASPVWMRRLAAPMRSYIRQHRGKFKELAYACTYGGSGAERAAAEVSALSGKTLKATLAVTSFELEQADYRLRLDAFLGQLKKA
ncbi:MAG TPA: flavodoxin [Gammaproteobacteria bacterium]|nr:flavodoxin [Gammaproteobacteria bacterium]